MARAQISHNSHTTAEELLQVAEIRGCIRLQLDIRLQIPRSMAHPVKGESRWLRLPIERPTIQVADADAAWEVVHEIDKLLHQMAKGSRPKTTKQEKTHE